MTKRKFYKTTFTLEVLSEEPLDSNVSIAEIAEMCDDGPCSGATKLVSVKELDGKQAANALIAQGSDPEFFQIDKNGCDLEEEEGETGEDGDGNMPKQKMRTVEYFRCWDGRKWDTDLIEIPAGTPADKIEDAIRKAVAKAFKAESAPAFVGLYNSNDDDAIAG